jgi:hypothetical protein
VESIMSTENDKGYKFRFEYIMTERFDDEHSPGSNETRFVSFGDTAKEAIEGHKALLDEWDKFLDSSTKMKLIKSWQSCWSPTYHSLTSCLLPCPKEFVCWQYFCVLRRPFRKYNIKKIW